MKCDIGDIVEIRFDAINNQNHREYYKWLIANKFHCLMDEALDSDDDEFADALYKIKACTENIIDSYTQPFQGLVEFPSGTEYGQADVP